MTSSFISVNQAIEKPLKPASQFSTLITEAKLKTLETKPKSKEIANFIP